MISIIPDNTNIQEMDIQTRLHKKENIIIIRFCLKRTLIQQRQIIIQNHEQFSEVTFTLTFPARAINLY